MTVGAQCPILKRLAKVLAELKSRSLHATTLMPLSHQREYWTSPFQQHVPSLPVEAEFGTKPTCGRTRGRSIPERHPLRGASPLMSLMCIAPQPWIP